MATVLPPVADPLGEALYFFRLSGSFYCGSEFTSPWALALPQFPGCMMLHVITSGSCWLEVEGTPNQRLHAGDWALLPHGQGHLMSSEPGQTGEPLFSLHREQLSDRYESLRLGGGGDRTTALCALFELDHPAARQLVTLLPKIITVKDAHSTQWDWLSSTIQMMAAEARELRPGGETIVTRLADILVIHAIRAWLAQAPAEQSGWLAAMRDSQIGRVMLQIHTRPEHPWTVESLAAEARMSRSAFSARFSELVGESAMHYVTRWRMHGAWTKIRLENLPVSDAAIRFGYESEAAFSRAFKRYMGVSPGSIRRK